MATNILRSLIENDKGELKKLEKMADKVIAYADQMEADYACFAKYLQGEEDEE